MKPFANTNAVVTGASSGIGQATAVALAKAGAERVLVHFHRNQEGAEETASQVRAVGGEVILHSADLSDASQRDSLLSATWKEFGVIHTWINNAGADVLTGEIADADFDTKLRRLMEVDVLGTFALSRQVAIRLGSQALAIPPSMIFIGWDQAPEGMEGDAGQMFGPVKAAVMAFANSLAQEVAPVVRVNTVAPGWIQTKWGETTGEYWDSRAKNQALMNRWGRSEDVARAILHLADPANTFATGQTVNVNGGWNRRYES